MPTGTDSLQLDLLTADPVSPTEGQVWWNTTDQQAKVRQAAATALGRLGDAVPHQPLAVLLKDENSSLRNAAAAAPEEIEEQIKRLRHPDEQNRAAAARMVGLSGRREGLPPLDVPVRGDRDQPGG